MKAEILTIGDELLRGEIVDSNKARMAQRLLELDIEPRYQASVCDHPEDMAESFRRAVARADVVLVSGGLGPTRDDLTASVLADTFGRPLVLDEASLETIRAFFAAVGREMRENNAKQAWFPEGSDILPNPVGTAPGFGFAQDRAVLYCMPGVPRELDKMMDEQVLPRLRKLREEREGPAPVQRHVLLRTFGMGESSLDAELQGHEPTHAMLTQEGVELGFRTAFPDNYLRPVVRAATAAEAESRLASAVKAIRERLGALIYGEGNETLEAVVVSGLAAAGRSVAVAESCTGGLIGQRLTSVPGSSEVFLGGVIAYSNEAKQALLGVPEAELATHGAVSEPVARAMALGARERFGADYGVATTGISGPGGGTAEKPVGLVYVALASGPEASDVHVDHFVFALDRERHRVLTAQVALDWVRRSLTGEPLIGPNLMRKDGGGSAPGGR